MPLATRIRGSLYNGLIETAARNDRPLGNEVELRIETTFRDEDTFDQVMTLRYGPTLSVALEAAGRAMLEISRFAPSPQSWADRPDLGDEMGWAAVATVAAFQGRKHPQGDRIIVAPNIVGTLLYAIKFPERAAPEQRHWAQPLHKKLGPEGVARLRVPPFSRSQIGPDGTVIGAQWIDGDTVTDMVVTMLPPRRRHALRFKVDEDKR